MSEKVESLKPDLAALSSKERVELMDFLVDLHDNEEISREEWEEEWLEEVNRRMADAKGGRTTAIPAEEVMRRMKEKYG